MSIVAETYEFVVGVDTHARTHQFALVAASTGALLAQAEFPAARAGLARAAAWIGRRTGGELQAVLVSIEGTGSYGATLKRLLLEQGYRVIDAPSPKREAGGDKNDAIDAIEAARGVLSCEVDQLVDAKSGETTEMLAVLLAARQRITGESTRARNALVALLRSHDLGLDARRKPSLAQVRQIARWRTPTAPTTAVEVAKAEAITLARRVVELAGDARANHKQLRQIVAEQMPTLLDQYGIGPVNAATILTAWSHPGRVRHEAAFARLGGVSPIQIASGQHTEHRLNRGGDRQLNKALHSIAMTRMRSDAVTRDYVDRRRAEGLSNRRIQRILKRYIARQIFRLINNAPHAEEVPQAA